MSRRGDWIQTFTGRRFWPLDPKPEDFDLEDIAHSLAMKCRFNGHCNQFYSVAQHCVYVAEECDRRWPQRLDLCIWGLLHDIEEAYLPDIPRPIKRMGTGTLEICRRKIMLAASARFGLYLPEPERVKQVDRALLAAEAHYLMNVPVKSSDWHLPERAANINICPVLPEKAKDSFLATADAMGLE